MAVHYPAQPVCQPRPSRRVRRKVGSPLRRRARDYGAHQEKRLEVQDLERALAKLPEEQRLALLLVGMEGMRYQETSAVLGVPVGTVRSRLSRGREALCQLMSMGTEPDEFDPDAARRRLLASHPPEIAIRGLACSRPRC
jgi:Sigma-70, region 4